MKIQLVTIVAVLAVAAMGSGLAQEDAVTAQVKPKTCEVSKILPGRPWRVPAKTVRGTPQKVMITYTVTNRSQRVQVLSRFCTIGLAVWEDGRPIPLQSEGRDGTRVVTPADIVILKPGEAGELTVSVYVTVLEDGKTVLLRQTEDGSSWTTGVLMVPGELRLTGTYDPALAALQSGFKSVDRDVVKFVQEMAGTDFEMVGKLKLPAVTVSLVK